MIDDRRGPRGGPGHSVRFAHIRVTANTISPNGTYMDQPFLELAKRATAGSCEVRGVIDSKESSRVRVASAVAANQNDESRSPLVRLQLYEHDGIMDWEETSGLPVPLDRFRSSASGTGSSGTGSSGTATSFDAIEFEFERLAPSQVTKFLVGKDQTLNPIRGFQRLQSGTPHRWQPAPFPESGDVLVFLHGTFSSGAAMLSGLLSDDNDAGKGFLDEAIKRFAGNVYSFEHPTLSVSPILNAIDLQRAMAGSNARVHLVSHSRGGLVARWWCELFDRLADRCPASVMVGSPLAGTGLAAPPNIRDTISWLTQIVRALQMGARLAALAVPVFSIVETLLRVLTSITGLAARTPVADAAMAMVPGLFGMSRVGNNPELVRLLSAPPEVPERYFAIRSDFQPEDPAWRFWRVFQRENIANRVMDRLFDGANDLVVDTASMGQLTDELKISPRRIHDFGTSPDVHHLNYFYQDATARFLGDCLL